MVIGLIEQLRKAIDEIDEELLNLLSKRRGFVREIAKLKESLDIPVLDKNREKKILDAISKKAKELELDVKFIKKLYEIILKNSRKEQKNNG